MDYNLAFETYLKRDEISCSQLKHLAKSPKTFKYFVIDDNSQPDTEAMKFGRTFHTFVLEPELFKKQYHIIPKIKGCGDVGKAKMEAEIGKTIWWEEDGKHIKLEGMKESIMEHPIAARFLKKSKNEVSMFWSENIDGKKVNCRGRIDAICDGGDNITLVDLKTTQDITESKFNAQAFDLKYHMQAAYYMHGYAKVNDGVFPKFFAFVAIEKTAPYLCNIFHVEYGDEAFELGTREYLKYLKDYVDCSKSNNWSGNINTSTGLHAPGWYKE